MTVQLVAVAIDAKAPKELARFWAQALRWSIRETDGGSVELVPTDATSFHVLFRPVADEKRGRNRIHFDLTTASLDDQHDTVSELLAIGGSHIDVGQDPDDTHVVLVDPEGNELCIIEPLSLGARRHDVDRGCPGAIVLADVDGNDLCLLEP